jgi:eukaryotic-like serine/threonine-protein kinase
MGDHLAPCERMLGKMTGMVDDFDILRSRANARLGQVLRDKWRLDEVLGMGGMAAVYAATHRNGKRVAIKMLHASLAIKTDTLRRFLREGYVANKVNHPDAVSVLDDDVTEEGCAFVVMELLEGETLEQLWLRSGRRLPAIEVLLLADQVLDVLAAAHAQSIIHRDIKPENIFLTLQGSTKLLDFGIARLREAEGPHGTRDGTFMGTPAFTPPEQARGESSNVDARTDIWALGATMFALLSGRWVHQADSMTMQLIAVATQPAPPLASVAPDVPAPLASVVDRALAFDPAARWPSAREMQSALREVYQAIMGVPSPLLARSAPSGRPAALAPSPQPVGAHAVTSAPVSRESMVIVPMTRAARGPWIVGGLAIGVAVMGGGLLVALRGEPTQAPASAAVEPAPPPAASSRTVDQPLPAAPPPAAPPPATTGASVVEAGAPTSRSAPPSPGAKGTKGTKGTTTSPKTAASASAATPADLLDSRQ